MNKKREMKEYEAPFTKKTQVELEDSICAGSHTDTPVVDNNNNKVEISEQEHGTWDGLGDDITTTWK